MHSNRRGIVLGVLMFIIASWINKTSCYLLVRSAILTKQNTYENLALLCLGKFGKLVTELSIIGFLLGICAAYYIVIGDLVPDIVSKWLNVTNDSWLRGWIMGMFGLIVILPLSLADNIDKLNRVSTICAVFYVLFSIKILFEALPTIIDLSWVQSIEYWRLEGMFHSLPIIALSLTCQTQIFLIYAALSEPNHNRMARVYGRAIDSCTLVYVFVGILGYLAFHVPKPIGLQGDVLLNLDKSSVVTDVVIIGFALSSALSFPLSLIPCRDSLVSLLWLSLRPLWLRKPSLGRKKNSSLPSLLDLQGDDDLDREDGMHGERRRLMTSLSTGSEDVSLPSSRARPQTGGTAEAQDGVTKINDPTGTLKIILTVVIVVTTFLVGLFVPKIEVMLGLIGSLMGTLLACILPALLFLKIRKFNVGPTSIFNESAYADKVMAQILFTIGIIVMVVGTANYIPTYDLNKPTVGPDPKLMLNSPLTVPQRSIVDNGSVEPELVRPPVTSNPNLGLGLPKEVNDKAAPILTINNLSAVVGAPAHPEFKQAAPGGAIVPENVDDKIPKAEDPPIVAGRNILESRKADLNLVESTNDSSKVDPVRPSSLNESGVNNANPPPLGPLLNLTKTGEA